MMPYGAPVPFMKMPTWGGSYDDDDVDEFTMGPLEKPTKIVDEYEIDVQMFHDYTGTYAPTVNGWLTKHLIAQGISPPVEVSFKNSVICPIITTPFSCQFTLLERTCEMTAYDKKIGGQYPNELWLKLKIPSNGECLTTIYSKLRELIRTYKKNLDLIQQAQGKTSISKFSNTRHLWIPLASKKNRLWESIFLRGNMREEIRSDLQLFRQLQSSLDWDDNRGRRIYLFHGPPGTGKSSLAQIIAAELKADIFRLALQGMTESALTDALSELPKKWLVVVLEDSDEIFEAGDSGTAGVNAADVVFGMSTVAPRMNQGTAVSFSSVLNFLDGPEAPTKVVYVLTTNRLTSYDPAVLRRVNRHWCVEGVDEKSVGAFLEFATKQTADADVVKRITTHMQKKEFQMSALHECITRAYFKSNIESPENPGRPSGEDVLEQILTFMPAGKGLVKSENPLCG